ncbi:MAG: (d)CMP kinase [Phycisphaerae bacterium]
MIITIDGTAGSGKTTAAAGLAKHLGADHLDTGAMYRALTLEALETGTDLEDAGTLESLAQSSNIELDGAAGEQRVRLDGRDVTEAIRESRVSTHSHYVARTPGVRRVMVEKQHAFATRAEHVVAEGRDQGPVVFPDAPVKFFLDADPAVRARRRQLELSERGDHRSYRDVLQEIQERDRCDSTRQASPLRPADDAIQVDTTKMTIDEMIETLLAEVRRRRKEAT